MPAGSLRFDRFELQPQERRLLADGAPVTLGARAFDLLLAMAARPGQLLTKAELLDAVWPGLVVEEANLSVQVSTLRKVLGDELIATIPGRGYRFTGTPSAIAASAGVPPAAAPAPRADRPAPARTLVDREAELARIDEILRVPGLVTLTGPAGVGKTALARALAARDARQPLWVDLAPLAYAGQVLAATARALGVSLPEDDPLPPVLRALEGRLLVLDNAEHLVEAVATFAANVLAAAPAQHILVTSQLPLRVAGEQLVRIEPLALPLGSDALDLHRGAVALFVERAHAADQRFHAGPTNLPLLREICRRLDGLPLALEMAAARVPVLGLAGLRDALEQRWSLLTAGRRDAPARHRTLQAALDWSYGLLAPAEQRLFRICSVFRGGFTLDLLMQVAAEGATADAAAGSTELAASDSGYAVIDALSQLVEGSLVASDASEPPRFALLESMREYARQKLATSGEEEAVRSRHAHAYARVAAAANAGGERERVLMLAEHHNLREALTWLRTREPARAVEMVTQVARIATFSAWRMDGLRWLESFAVEAADPSVPPVVRAHWVHERARQLLMSRDPRARSLAQYARSLYRALGDELGEFEALGSAVRASAAADDEVAEACAAMRALLERHPEWSLRKAMSLAGAAAWACELRNDFEGALRQRLVERELAVQDGWQAMVDAADSNVVIALVRLDRAAEALERSTALLERMAGSDSGNAAYAWLFHLGALLKLRRFDEFRAAAPRAASVLRKNGLPLITDLYAVMLAEEGRAHDAARMMGHVRAAYRAAGMGVERTSAANLARAERLARAQLDPRVFEACLAEGAGFDDTAADRLALGAASTIAAATTLP